LAYIKKREKTRETVIREEGVFRTKSIKKCWKWYYEYWCKGTKQNINKKEDIEVLRTFEVEERLELW